jgi:hypothetical protein
MSDRWYYARGRETLGPVPFSRLQELAAAGELLPGDLVLEEGAPGWREGSSVERLLFRPEPAPAAPAPAGEQAGPADARQKLEGAVSAFLAVPLYMLAAGLVAASLLVALARESPEAASRFGGPLGKYVLVFYVALLGIGVRSLQCVFLLESNPFRAVAMGRYVFGLYLAVSLPFAAYHAWPRAEVTAARRDVFKTSIDFRGQAREVLVMDPARASEKRPGGLDYLRVLFAKGSELVEKLAILIFLQAVYRRLKGDQPDYALGHFWHDVTFGWYGAAYPWKKG